MDTHIDVYTDINQQTRRYGPGSVTAPRPFSPYDFSGPAWAHWDDVWAWGATYAKWANHRDPDMALLVINEARRTAGLPEFFPSDFIDRFGHEPPEEAFVHARLIAARKARVAREAVLDAQSR